MHLSNQMLAQAEIANANNMHKERERERDSQTCKGDRNSVTEWLLPMQTFQCCIINSTIPNTHHLIHAQVKSLNFRPDTTWSWILSVLSVKYLHKVNIYNVRRAACWKTFGFHKEGFRISLMQKFCSNEWLREQDCESLFIKVKKSILLHYFITGRCRQLGCIFNHLKAASSPQI